jgi:hypothetical protein
MTYLGMFLYNFEEVGAVGLFSFLSISAVALFAVFLPIATWLSSRRQEREAFYKAETFRRVAEATGEGARAALELIRDEERFRRIKSREGLKIGGVINICVGVSLVIFLRSLGGASSPYLCGLIPGFIGVGMLIYVYFLAAPIE